MARMILMFIALAVCINAAFAVTHQNPTNDDFVCWNEAESKHTLAYRDCIDTLNQQVIRDHPMEIPLKFSPDPGLEPDIELPAHWFSRTSNCFVGINFAPDETGYDRASPKDLRTAAQALGAECVIKPPHRGGVHTIGWRDKMGLVFVAEPEKRNRTIATE
ncbi:MAG: hypothetical protein LQ352_002987 [Teloschistes flavicans]|nr:MAG: hypothetical protein LQ352_002987 [Teloschistes flavicans]